MFGLELAQFSYFNTQISSLKLITQFSYFEIKIFHNSTCSVFGWKSSVGISIQKLNFK